VAGNAVLAATRGYPFVPDERVFLIEVAFLVAYSVAMLWMISWAVIRMLVPLSISFRQDRVLADFRRKGWRGPPFREMKFENMVAIRRELLTRVATVRARWDPSVPALVSSTCFYLTETNADRIRQSLASYRAARKRSEPGRP
jgi:hypothetical protein